MTGLVLLLVGQWCLMVRFLSWNVRGLNDWDKRVFLIFFLWDWKCVLVYLQLTKLENIQHLDIHSIWGNQTIGCVALNAIGTVGGILVMWAKTLSNWCLLVGIFQSLASSEWSMLALRLWDEVCSIRDG